MFNRKMVLNLMAATVLVASLAGCGSNPAAPEELYDPTLEPGYTDPANPYGGTTPGATTPGYGNNTGYGTTPGYGNTPSYGAVGAELTASVASKKNGSFLGMGKFKCTIEVSNPSSTPATGTLTVTFTNGKKNSKTAPITKQVSLSGNETQTFDFEDKSWTTDNVTAEITTDASTAAPAPAYGAPAGGAYGAPATTYGTTPAAGSYPATGY